MDDLGTSGHGLEKDRAAHVGKVGGSQRNMREEEHMRWMHFGNLWVGLLTAPRPSSEPT